MHTQRWKAKQGDGSTFWSIIKIQTSTCVTNASVVKQSIKPVIDKNPSMAIDKFPSSGVSNALAIGKIQVLSMLRIVISSRLPYGMHHSDHSHQ